MNVSWLITLSKWYLVFRQYKLNFLGYVYLWTARNIPGFSSLLIRFPKYRTWYVTTTADGNPEGDTQEQYITLPQPPNGNLSAYHTLKYHFGEVTMSNLVNDNIRQISYNIGSRRFMMMLDPDSQRYCINNFSTTGMQNQTWYSGLFDMIIFARG